MKLLLSSFVLLIFSFFSNATFAVSKVTLSDVHICCSTCQETINMLFLESKGPTSKLTKMLKPLPSMENYQVLSSLDFIIAVVDVRLR